MNAWNPNPTHRTTRRPDRRDLAAFLVTVIAVAVLVGGMLLIGAADAAGDRRHVPTVSPTRQLTIRCTPIMRHQRGTLLGCTDGSVRWAPKAATR